MSSLVVSSALLFLACLDLLLALWVFSVPDGFYRFFFGIETGGNRGVLYRSGGLWLTFSLLQSIALLTWTTYPVVLLLIVGVRLSEWCADWVFLLSESRFTVLGQIGFFVSPVFTVSFAVLFLFGYWSIPIKPVAAMSLIHYEPGPLLLDGLLTVLVLADFVLAWAALVDPDRWFGWLSADRDSDPAGLWSRTAGIWMGFVLLQLAVLLSWRIWPLGLAVVAGMRLTETLADWIYLVGRTNRRPLSTAVLSVIPLLNGALALCFYQGFIMTQA